MKQLTSSETIMSCIFFLIFLPLMVIVLAAESQGNQVKVIELQESSGVTADISLTTAEHLDKKERRMTRNEKKPETVGGMQRIEMERSETAERV